MGSVEFSVHDVLNSVQNGATDNKRNKQFFFTRNFIKTNSNPSLPETVSLLLVESNLIATRTYIHPLKIHCFEQIYRNGSHRIHDKIIHHHLMASTMTLL